MPWPRQWLAAWEGQHALTAVPDGGHPQPDRLPSPKRWSCRVLGVRWPPLPPRSQPEAALSPLLRAGPALPVPQFVCSCCRCLERDTCL